jgi:hypothetical protein
MANRKANCEKSDFASKLRRLGFEQVGDSTFTKHRIKIFRTNTIQRAERHWEVQEISSGRIFFSSKSSFGILEYLLNHQFMPDGGTVTVSLKVKPKTNS